MSSCLCQILESFILILWNAYEFYGCKPFAGDLQPFFMISLHSKLLFNYSEGNLTCSKWHCSYRLYYILDQLMTCRWKNYQAKYSNRNVNIYKLKVDVKFTKSPEEHLYFYVPENNVSNVPVNQNIDYLFN